MQCVLGDLVRERRSWQNNWLEKSLADEEQKCWHLEDEGCIENLYFGKIYLIGPRRRQQLNFFNAFPFTHFIWITAYHPALLYYQTQRWRHFGEKHLVLFFYLGSSQNSHTSLKYGFISNWICIIAHLLFPFARETLLSVYLLFVTHRVSPSDVM